MVKRILIFLAVTVVLLIAVAMVVSRVGAPLAQGDLADLRVYAYRDWQSSGVHVNAGDRVSMRADGSWLYTPKEYNGPEGHPIYPAPTFYPDPHARAGALLGRVGESGQEFIVGRRRRIDVTKDGMLYFRINDDILSDNDGYVTVDIEILPEDAR